MRRLTPKQQALAESCIRFVEPAIASFLKKNPDLYPAAKRVDLRSVAHLAICHAAVTYRKAKSQPTTYFSSAIRHALFRAVLTQQKLDGRYIPVERILDPQPKRDRTRREMRALKAISMLSAYDRYLLEDRLVEAVTLEQLGSEQRLDPRTIAKRVQDAIDRLKQAESHLP
jgi:DNA-directed RNA polymerase specialized sigma24 family protein